jgi:hypothetical protein
LKRYLAGQPLQWTITPELAARIGGRKRAFVAPCDCDEASSRRGAKQASKRVARPETLRYLHASRGRSP